MSGPDNAVFIPVYTLIPTDLSSASQELAAASDDARSVEGDGFGERGCELRGRRQVHATPILKAGSRLVGGEGKQSATKTSVPGVGAMMAAWNSDQVALGRQGEHE